MKVEISVDHWSASWSR